MLRTATRRAMLYPPPAATAVGDWWTWLDASYTVVGAYDFRSAASLADATKIGSTPSIVNQPGGGLNIGASGLVCNADTRINTGIVPTATSSIMIVFVDTLTSNVSIAGVYDTTTPTTRFQLHPNWNGNGYYGYGIALKSFSGETLTAGTTGMTGGGAGTGYCYHNGGTGEAIDISGWVNTTYTVYLGGWKSTTLSFYFRGTIAAAVMTSDVVSPSDMATLHTLMSA